MPGAALGTWPPSDGAKIQAAQPERGDRPAAARQTVQTLMALSRKGRAALQEESVGAGARGRLKPLCIWEDMNQDKRENLGVQN